MQEVILQNNYVNLKETISLLGVSSATVRNWIRHSYLIPEKRFGKNLIFNYGQLNDLKQKITLGEVNRLNTRANKKNSANIFIPDEYADNQEMIDLVQEITNIYKSNNLQKGEVLLMLAINLLKKNNLIKNKNIYNLKN